MSTELTPEFEHRLNPQIKLWLEEQFGHLQLVVEGDGHAFVFRLKDEDAERLASAMLAWVSRIEVPLFIYAPNKVSRNV